MSSTGHISGRADEGGGGAVPERAEGAEGEAAVLEGMDDLVALCEAAVVDLEVASREVIVAATSPVESDNNFNEDEDARKFDGKGSEALPRELVEQVKRARRLGRAYARRLCDVNRYVFDVYGGGGEKSTPGERGYFFSSSAWARLNALNARARRSAWAVEDWFWNRVCTDQERAESRYAAFLSHTGKQKDFSSMLKGMVESDPLFAESVGKTSQVFVDQTDLLPGDPAEDRMIGAVCLSHTVLCVLSKDYLVMEWPMYEHLLASARAELQEEAFRPTVAPIAFAPEVIPSGLRRVVSSVDHPNPWIDILKSLPLLWSEWAVPTMEYRWANKPFNEAAQRLTRAVVTRAQRAVAGEDGGMQRVFELPAAVANFTGRAGALSELKSEFLFNDEDQKGTVDFVRESVPSPIGTKSVVLSALGGMGKTATAIQYAQDHVRVYAHGVFWLSAATASELRAALRRMAWSEDGLGMKELKDEKDFDFAAVCRRVSQKLLDPRRKWLVILDNADDPADLLQPGLLDWLPGRSGVSAKQQHALHHVLITSRLGARAFSAASHAQAGRVPLANVCGVELQKLSLDASAQLLASSAHRDGVDNDAQKSALDWICGLEALDGLPLALIQAGSYCEESGCSFLEYRALLEAQKLRLPSSRDMAEAGSSLTYFLEKHEVPRALWPNFEDIVATPRDLTALSDAKELLEEIGGESHGFKRLTAKRILQAADEWEPPQRVKIVDTVWQVTLVRLSVEARTFLEVLCFLSPHDLPAALEDAFIRTSQLASTARGLWRELEKYSLVSKVLLSRPSVLETDEMYSIHRLLSTVVRQSLLECHASISGPLFSSNNEGGKKGALRLSAALAVLETALPSIQDWRDDLEAAKKIMCGYHLHVRVAVDCFNDGYGTGSDDAIAAQGLAWQEDSGRMAHILYNDALYLRSSAYRIEEEEVARLQFLKAAKLARQAFSANGEVELLAESYALVISTGERYDIATRICKLRQVLVRAKQSLGTEHVGTAELRSNLASILGMVDFEAAEVEYRAVLAVQKRVLGPEHPETLLTRRNFASAMQSHGQHVPAETEYRVVLAVQERLLGTEHPSTLTTRHLIAMTMMKQDQHAVAEAEFRTLLAVQERVLGPEHPNTLMTRHNLASTISKQGQLAAAEAEYRAVLAVRERVLGPKHPHTLFTRVKIAKVMYLQGQTVAAKAEFRALSEVLDSASCWW